MAKFLKFLKKIIDLKKNDPFYSCPIYNNEKTKVNWLFYRGGCSHVDGPLCDFPNCKSIEKIVKI